MFKGWPRTLRNSVDILLKVRLKSRRCIFELITNTSICESNRKRSIYLHDFLHRRPILRTGHETLTHFCHDRFPLRVIVFHYSYTTIFVSTYRHCYVHCHVHERSWKPFIESPPRACTSLPGHKSHAEPSIHRIIHFKSLSSCCSRHVVRSCTLIHALPTLIERERFRKSIQTEREKKANNSKGTIDKLQNERGFKEEGRGQ